MSPPINLVVKPIEIKLKTKHNNDDILTATKSNNKRVSLTNLNEKLLNLNESRLSLDENYLFKNNHTITDTNHVINNLNDTSIKTLNEKFQIDDNLEDDMIGLGSLSSTGSNTDSLKRELEELNLNTNENCESIINRSTSRADTGIGSDLLSNISTSPLPTNSVQSNLNNQVKTNSNLVLDERNNSISTTNSDDLSDFDLVNDDLNTNKFKIINDLTVIYPMGVNSDLEDDDQSNRRDTIIFLNNNEAKSRKIKFDQSDLPKSDTNNLNVSNSIKNSSLQTNSSLSSVNSQYFACDVASLSSVYSNYSQFEFLQQNRQAPSPPPLIETNLDTKNQETTNNSSNTGLSSFLGIFGNKKQDKVCSNDQQSTPNKFDLITSKLFNFNKNSNQKQTTTTTAGTSIEVSKPTTLSSNEKQSISYSSTSSSSTSLTDQYQSDCLSIKTNHSHNNLNYNSTNSINSDLQVPNSVLIFENRPSNLPAKSQQEEQKHRQEYEKMVEIAKKKEQKEKEMKLKKQQQQMKKEDFMANSLKIWNSEIIPYWTEQKSSKRTHQLWWHGLPPSIRGKVWKLAIGNDLNLTKESYYFYEKKAKQKLELLSKYESSSEKDNDKTHESSVELIKLDVSRTFPQLCFFQKDGPYHEALHNVLGAYACFNTQIGYVQGMSFLTAILLLNMEALDAFICLSNLLNTKILLACFCMDQAKMNRYFRVHQILLEYNLPKLYRHFEEQNVKPDLYLIEWIFTLFSKSLPLDVMSRVWDVFFRDKEEFLFRTALGILNLYKETLLELDFIHVVQFLTKLPENINSTQLFKSIEQINMCIDDITFENLINYNS